MARIFISYASPDRAFATRLAHTIKELGHVVWLDLWRIGIGDSMLEKIGEGIELADYVVVVFSQQTAQSVWVSKEWQIKYCEELAQRRTAILPVVIEDCLIPPFLRARRFADFRRGYELGLAQLAVALHAPDTVTVYRNASQSNEQTGEDASGQEAPPACYNDAMVQVARLHEVNVELGIPYLGKIVGSWKPDEEEQRAAWELYIELVTRVTVAGLQPEEGLLRESLSSLYSVFTITRDILRRHGPSIARPKNGSDISFGHLAINILNLALRPVLTKWHPLLLDYEHAKAPALSAFEHEQRWEKAAELRAALYETRLVLIEYTRILAQVADIPLFADAPLPALPSSDTISA